MNRQATITIITAPDEEHTACASTDAVGPFDIAVWALMQMDARVSLESARTEVQQIQDAGNLEHTQREVSFVRTRGTAIVVSVQVY